MALKSPSYTTIKVEYTAYTKRDFTALLKVNITVRQINLKILRELIA